MEDLSVVISLKALCSTCRLDTWVQTQGPFSSPPAPVPQSGLFLRASFYPPEGKTLFLQSRAHLTGSEMQVRPPGLGAHPSFLPSVLASIPGGGWGGGFLWQMAPHPRSPGRTP